MIQTKFMFRKSLIMFLAITLRLLGGWNVRAAEILIEPRAIIVEDDFEQTAVGAVPQGAGISEEYERGGRVRVTDEAAASGRHSLKIQDAAGLRYNYNPHFWYLMPDGGLDGVVQCSFDLRIEAGTYFWHAWRDWVYVKDPYYEGPSFRVRDGKLWVEGEALLDLPVGQWFHVEISARVGKEADGIWAITIKLPDQAAKRFDGLRFANPNFRKLTWVGFISMATEQTAFYLDNIQLFQ